MDTTNWHLVTVAGHEESIVIQRPPVRPMSKRDALLFAAWIVAVAEEQEGEFEEILNAVKAT